MLSMQKVCLRVTEMVITNPNTIQNAGAAEKYNAEHTTVVTHKQVMIAQAAGELMTNMCAASDGRICMLKQKIASK